MFSKVPDEMESSVGISESPNIESFSWPKTFMNYTTQRAVLLQFPGQTRLTKRSTLTK